MNAYHGFELIYDRPVRELKTAVFFYRHVATGAEVLSLVNDDTNKVFGITFRTPPRDSTGVAHILEHSVLCGSRKYPVKEPFVELLKGSLQTFLNAFTYPDKTCYPVASQNLRDFYNLIDVYLDAVFYPRINRHIFEQEGWHYELDGPDSPMSYKGVVFNEMKGAYASPENLLAHHSQMSVFPDTLYGVDSGGDPKKIPGLTFEAFREFHRRHYHPSNARIYFYGDDDPQERLRYLDTWLSQFAPQPPDSSIALQERIAEPRRLMRTYPAGKAEGPGGGKAMATVNWLLTPVVDVPTTLTLSMLAFTLLGMSASPLRKALLDSGLGDGLAGIGLEAELAQLYFSTGLKGVAPERLDEVEPFILSALETIARDGIDPLTVEAAINTMEFSLRENNTGRFPLGLALMLRCLTVWLYGGDPVDALSFEAPLASLKKRIAAEPGLFSQLIRQHFLGNTHRSTVLLTPDAQLAEINEAAEKLVLEQAKASLSPAEVQAVADNARQLKLLQQTPDPPEALALIPRLGLADLERTNRLIPCENIVGRTGGAILYHDLFTNGIFYLDIGLNLHLLPQQYLPYAGLLGRLLLETGTAREDFVALSQRIGRSTGGLRCSIFTSSVVEASAGAAWLLMRGKAMASGIPELMAICGDILRSARIDDPVRFRQILLEERSAQEQRLVPSGHQLVSSRLQARFSEADWADEQMNGITYLQFLRQLEKQIETDWESVAADLRAVRELLVQRPAMVVNVTADAGLWRSAQAQTEAFLASLPDGKPLPAAWQPGPPPPGEAMVVPTPVNYVGKGANLYSLGYRYHGSVHVIAHLLRTSYLWEHVRVQGGAYGAFCSFDRLSGGFVFVSYRDPNLLATLDIYDKTAAFLRSASITGEELVKNIIGAIGDLDSYLLPDARGVVSLQRYFNGVTDASRQQMRDEILATTPAHVRAFADSLDAMRDSGAVAVMGAAQAVEQANDERGLFPSVLTLM